MICLKGWFLSPDNISTQPHWQNSSLAEAVTRRRHSLNLDPSGLEDLDIRLPRSKGCHHLNSPGLCDMHMDGFELLPAGLHGAAPGSERSAGTAARPAPGG